MAKLRQAATLKVSQLMSDRFFLGLHKYDKKHKSIFGLYIVYNIYEWLLIPPAISMNIVPIFGEVHQEYQIIFKHWKDK